MLVELRFKLFTKNYIIKRENPKQHHIWIKNLERNLLAKFKTSY